MNNTQSLRTSDLPEFVHGPLPNDSTPVSTDESNAVVSCFGDNIWDYSNSAYTYSKDHILNFSLGSTNPSSNLLIYQVKLVLYYIIFSRKRRDNNITVSSIYNKFTHLRKIALLCLNHDCDFTSIQSNRSLLRDLKYHLADLSWDSQKKYIQTLHQINKAGLLYDIENFGFTEKYITDLKKNQDLQLKTYKQTILIPVSIYAKFIDSGLTFFEELAPSINNIYSMLDNELFYKYKVEKKHLQPVIFKQLTEKYNLEAYFSKYEITNNQKLLFFFQAIQTLGAQLILCFSGMRKSESLNLNLNSYQEIKRRNLPSAWVFRGTTSKLTSAGAVATSWVTSDVIRNVISSLQTLVRIHKTWSDHKCTPTHLEIDQYPLFPSFASKHEVSFHPIFQMPLGAYTQDHNTIYRIIAPIIFTENDYDELNKFNPLVDWLADYNLEFGKPWKFSPHQFRRALTVYCARSGLVKIPTLKRQLKHISYDMTFYYVNNYMNAKNIIREAALISTHFEASLISEYKHETLLQQLSDFTENVVNYDKSSFGAEGIRIQNQKKLDDKPTYLTDRKTTEKYVFDGRITYRKTALGGCSRPNGCNKLSFSFVTACIECSHAIFNEDSIHALNLAKESYAEIAELKLEKGETLLYEQCIKEIEAIDRLLKKSNINQIEIKNV